MACSAPRPAPLRRPLHGFPILYFHGHPRLPRDLDFIDPDHLARDRGIRIIALDRPGYGLSTQQLGRQLNDWPHDVMAAVDELGVRPFSVLGYSGGWDDTPWPVRPTSQRVAWPTQRWWPG